MAGARSFVLFVDDQGLAPERQQVARAALERFVDQGLRDGDEVIFATSSGDSWWAARMPEGREDLRALAARVRGRGLSETAVDSMSQWEAYRITNVEGFAQTRGEAMGGGLVTVDPLAGTISRRDVVAGAIVAERVFARWMERRVCDPYAPEVCRSAIRRRAQEVDIVRLNRTRAVLRGVDQAVFALSGQRGRKAFVLLSEGFLHDASLGELSDVAGRCREANIAVYSLDPRGLLAAAEDRAAAASGGPPDAAEMGLMQAERVEFESAGSAALAENTGGFAVRHSNDLAAELARVAEESRVYYLLGFTPPAGKGPRDWRALRVQVKRPGLRVRARKGYTLRSVAEIAAAEEARRATRRGRRQDAEQEAPPVPVEVARALASAADRGDIPLRASAYVLDQTASGALRTLVAVEVDLSRVANLGGDERPRTVLSLSVAVAHRDTARTQRVDQRIEVDAGAGAPDFDGWLALSREFDLPPGVAQARAVVRDEFLGRVGAATVRFEVPDPAGLRLSTPILTHRMLAATPGAPSRPLVLARREFAARGLLYCLFQVFGAGSATEVDAFYVLRTASGRIIQRGLSTALEAGQGGPPTRLLGLPLDGLTPGDYELLIRVRDLATETEAERLEPLRLMTPG
jgi:VWFA-related protein